MQSYYEKLGPILNEGGFRVFLLAKTEHSHPLERFNPFTIEP